MQRLYPNCVKYLCSGTIATTQLRLIHLPRSLLKEGRSYHQIILKPFVSLLEEGLREVTQTYLTSFFIEKEDNNKTTVQLMEKDLKKSERVY